MASTPYTVSGSGMFPIDMLRYDAAWPATSADVPLICSGNRGLRVVRIRSAQKPTVGRWASFGWTVIERR